MLNNTKDTSLTNLIENVKVVMIKNILILLNEDQLYGVSKNIDIAKGMYKFPHNFRELKLILKRIWKSK